MQLVWTHLLYFSVFFLNETHLFLQSHGCFFAELPRMQHACIHWQPEYAYKDYWGLNHIDYTHTHSYILVCRSAPTYYICHSFCIIMHVPLLHLQHLYSPMCILNIFHFCIWISASPKSISRKDSRVFFKCDSSKGKLWRGNDCKERETFNVANIQL